jgi:hypothetical protein
VDHVLPAEALDALAQVALDGRQVLYVLSCVLELSSR